MSRLAIFLASLLSLGVGLLAGFGLLYLRYKEECNLLLDKTNAGAVSTSRELKAQHQACLKKEAESQRKCQEKQSQTLEAHSALVMQHQSLLDKKAVMQKESDGYVQTIQSLQEQIKRLNREMGQSAVDAQHTKLQADQKVEALQQQLTLTQGMLQQKTKELEEQEGGGGAGGESVFAASKSLSEIKTAIQRQYWAQFLFQYESRGPFQIRFQLDNDGINSFVVEFSTAETFSMTVRTALNLAEAGLYIGTTMKHDETNDFLLTGGNPHHAASRIQSNLKRRFAEHGFGMEPFLWVELANDASKTCERTPGAFWFPSKGPQFSITLPPHVSNNEAEDQDGPAMAQNPACHGRVVQGMSVLQQVFVQTHPHQGSSKPPTTVTIANAQVLVPNKSSSSNNNNEPPARREEL